MTRWRTRLNPLIPLREVARLALSNVGEPRYYVGDARNLRDDAGLPGETVLLIQGWFQTRRVMETLECRLRADGYRVVSFHLGGFLNNFNSRGIHASARMIDAKIHRLRERYGLGKVHVIGHSMGGLVARYLIQRIGGQDYARTLITLGTPHHGTPTAGLAAGIGMLFVSRSLWQLFPMSPLIRQLNTEPFPSSVRLVSVYSTGDIVAPWRTSVLTPRDGAAVRNIKVRGLGHMGLVEDPWVYGLILRELQGRPHDSASGPVADVDEEFSRV